MNDIDILERNKEIVLMLNLNHAYSWDMLKFNSDWNWLMEAVNFTKKNFRQSNDTTDAKINELFIDEWEFSVNKYYIRLIQWTNDGWRMFNGKNNNDDLSMFYIIGENCQSEKEAIFKAISDFSKVYNKNKI